MDVKDLPPSSSSSSTTTKETDSPSLQENNDIIIPLSDCMQCYVRIPRCPVPPQSPEDHPVPPPETHQDLPAAATVPPPGPSDKEIDEEEEEEEEEWYGEGFDREDFNMMERFIYLDLPWPPVSPPPSDDTF